MADTKLSAIAAAGAIAGANTIIGVQGGATDVQYTFTAAATFFWASPVLVTPNLGTPSAGVMTNVTGTASGLTAGNVTTNANLTGVITSSGNATSIASQTGTGTKFVVDTSPTLVTPVIGVAAGTSLALGGGSIGSDALEVTGTSTFNGNLSVVSGSLITSGNLSAAAWTTSGVRNKMAAASYTDTSSSGTVAAAYTDLFGASTVLASSATTYTNYYGSYFVAPVASTNVTMTNKFALGADTANFTGVTTLGGALTYGGVTLSNAVTGTGNMVLSAAPTLTGTATTGAISSSGQISSSAASAFRATNATGTFQLQNGSTILSSPTGASLQFGAADADTNASIVAQTLRSQGALAGGTSDQAGKNWTFIASPGKGTGAGGSFIFQTTPAGSTGTVVGTATTALTINSSQSLITAAGDASASSGSGALQVAGGASVAKRFWIPAITTSSGLQTAVLCQSSGGEMIADSVACLASSARFKTLLGAAEDGALGKISRIPIHRWKYRREDDSVFPDNYYSEHIGPTAEDIEAIDSRLVGRDQEGRARSISTDQLLALTIQALQEQQEQIEGLKQRLAA